MSRMNGDRAALTAPPLTSKATAVMQTKAAALPRRELRSHAAPLAQHNAILQSAEELAAAEMAKQTRATVREQLQPSHSALPPQPQQLLHPQPLAAPAAAVAPATRPSSSNPANAPARGLQSGTITHRLPGAAAAAAKGADPSKLVFTVPEVVSDPSVKRINSAGKTVCKQYRRGRYLGKGGFAVCYELTSLDSRRTYAGKIIPRITLVNKPSAQKKMVHEIKIHRSINHPNVVKFERFFEDEHNVYLLLEICSNHTLMEMVKRRGRLTETETQYYMWQLVNTMIHLHSNNIIHRDLKLGNLFLNEHLDIRIGDFGLATQLDHVDQRKSTLCGTPNYIAPEILAKEGHSFEVDTWAMGVIMYTMLIGRPPFETASVDSTYERIRSNVYDFPRGVAISPAARAMIERILNGDAKCRPSLQALRGDPFFTQSPFPSRLPLSCLTTPLVWKHTCHPDSGAVAGAVLQENAPVAMQGVHKQLSPHAHLQQQQLQQQALAPAPRTALSSRASANNLPQAPSSQELQKPLSRPATATATTANQVAPAVVARPATATVAAVALAHPQQQENSAPTIAVAKRHSGGGVQGAIIERRVTRRTSGEEARAATASLAAQVYPVAAVAAAAADPLDAVVAAMASADLNGGKQKSAAAGAAAVEIESGGVGDAGSDDPDEEEEKGALRKMHDEIERSFCGPEGGRTAAPAATAAAPAAATAPLPHASLWVNKWVDYSNKYGLGYLLSNGDSGVYFNDSSKAVLHADGERFEYVERKQTAPSAAAAAAAAAAADGSGVALAPVAVPERMCYTLSNFPPALQKKVTLLRHFSSHLVKPAEGAAAAAASSATPAAAAGPKGASSASSSCSSDDGGMVYVKKWLRTKHAIFFRLSNRTVQVIFQDQTELVLCASSNAVTYTDKSHTRSTSCMDMLAADAARGAPARPDLAKRMKYTKDILHLLLTKGAAANANGAAAASSAAASAQ